ncbi:MAG: ABC transporter permease [Planctomycetes bacterium]|nr:ABC transporter permease [Planctomycetota bacterium]MCB9912067.1 ABC transporter permease [Planctomycetota bacterium]HPF14703.1 ABC transporter permease [Planctomycetota bacterium]
MPCAALDSLPKDAWIIALALVLAYLLWQRKFFRDFCDETAGRLLLLAAVLMRLHHLPRRMRWFKSQMFSAGIGNVHVVLLVGLFIGMILAMQTGVELARFGQQDQLGFLVSTSMAREMGPFVTAIILAATFGSALAAELGTMSVSDELTALEVLSVDRVSFLVLPRVLALMVMCPMLTIFCDAVGILGGGFISVAQLNVSWGMYWDTAFSALQTKAQFIPIPKDVYAGLFKSFIFGGLIAIVSCSAGMAAQGGALGVGRATSRAVRDSIIATIIANYFLTWMIYS